MSLFFFFKLSFVNTFFVGYIQRFEIFSVGTVPFGVHFEKDMHCAVGALVLDGAMCIADTAADTVGRIVRSTVRSTVWSSEAGIGCIAVNIVCCIEAVDVVDIVADIAADTAVDIDVDIEVNIVVAAAADNVVAVVAVVAVVEAFGIFHDVEVFCM